MSAGDLLLVALGGAVGAPLRFVAAHHLDRALPWGTLLVNVVGSTIARITTASRAGVRQGAGE